MANDNPLAQRREDRLKEEAAKKAAGTTDTTTTAAPDTTATDTTATAAATDTTAAATDTTADVVKVDSEITEEQFKAYLEKQGVKVNSVTDIKERFKTELSPEEKEKQSQDEKLAKIKFGQDAKIISSVEEYAQREALKNEPEEKLAFNGFAKKYKAENADATPEEIQEAFDENYHQNIDEETATDTQKRLKKIGASDIKKYGAKIKAKEIAPLSKLDEGYNSWKDREVKGNNYVSVVKDVIGEIKSDDMTFDFGDDKNKVSVSIPVKDLKTVSEDYLLKGDLFGRLVHSNKHTDKAEVKNALSNFVFLKNKEAIMAKVKEDAYKNGHAKGIEEAKTGVTEPVLGTDNQAPKQEVKSKTPRLDAKIAAGI